MRLRGFPMRLDHLVCFSSGMFALAAADWPPPIPKAWMVIAKGLGLSLFLVNTVGLVIFFNLPRHKTYLISI